MSVTAYGRNGVSAFGRVEASAGTNIGWDQWDSWVLWGTKVALLFVGSIGFHTPKRRHAVTPVRPHAHLPLVSLILIPPMYLVTNRFGGYAMVLRCRLLRLRMWGGASCSQSLIAPSVVDIQVVTATPNAQNEKSSPKKAPDLSVVRCFRCFSHFQRPASTAS
jgi:hypothetical protein